MDWGIVGGIITAIVGVLGMGGFGGIYLNNKKINAEIKRAAELNHAKIEAAKAESALLVEKARVELINDLQQERDKCEERLQQAQERIRDLEDQISLWKSRASMLEMILADNGIPVPA